MGQRCTHAGRMHQSPRRAPTVARIAAGVERGTNSPSRGRRRAGRDAGRAGGHSTRSRPPRSSQRTQDEWRVLIPISIGGNASQSHEKPLRSHADGDRGAETRRSTGESHRRRGEATRNASHGPRWTVTRCPDGYNLETEMTRKPENFKNLKEKLQKLGGNIAQTFQKFLCKTEKIRCYLRFWLAK